MKKTLLLSFLFLFFTFPFLSFAENTENNEVWATVISIYDGDTFTVEIEGVQETEKVRILGIDTPEIKEGTKTNCKGKEVKEFISKKILGEKVLLIRDKKEKNRDSFGRLLRYVALDGKKDLGKDLLKRGYAVVYEKSDFTKKKNYQKLKEKAEKRKKGIFDETCTLEDFGNADAEEIIPKTDNDEGKRENIFYGNSANLENPIKKSHRSATCHDTNSFSYKNTKYFDAYETMEECLQSGGKHY